MTNRKWLSRMTDDELAEWVCDWDRARLCPEANQYRYDATIAFLKDAKTRTGLTRRDVLHLETDEELTTALCRMAFMDFGKSEATDRRLTAMMRIYLQAEHEEEKA